MSSPSLNSEPSSKGFLPLVWGLTLLLVTIGLVAVARRTYVLLQPPSLEPPRFAAAAVLDASFAQHRMLTLLHILPAGLLMGLMPLQFVGRIRAEHTSWHRWLGRFLVMLGLTVGLIAIKMSLTMAIAGTSETAATTLYAMLFLVFLGLGFWSIRQRRIAQHREWMIRAFGVALGIAATRPLVGAFFAAGLSPHEFFGTAFWLGFTLTSAAAEGFIRFSRRAASPLAIRT